jgi:hypothetical protein
MIEIKCGLETEGIVNALPVVIFLIIDKITQALIQGMVHCQALTCYADVVI